MEPDFARLLTKFSKMPENSKCADCGEDGPSWASVKLGIFICLRCSGIHRSLGTHISFVRSLTLDTWTPEQVKTMVAIGNERAKEHWEARLPPTYKRPTDTSGVSVFIKDKYVNHRFVSRSHSSKTKSKDAKEESSSTTQTAATKNGENNTHEESKTSSESKSKSRSSKSDSKSESKSDSKGESKSSSKSDSKSDSKKHRKHREHKDENETPASSATPIDDPVSNDWASALLQEVFLGAPTPSSAKPTTSSSATTPSSTAAATTESTHKSSSSKHSSSSSAPKSSSSKSSSSSNKANNDKTENKQQNATSTKSSATKSSEPINHFDNILALFDQPPAQN